MHTNPKRIFNLPDQEVRLSGADVRAFLFLLNSCALQDTYVVVNMDERWTIPKAMTYSKCGWTPFAGIEVQGRAVRVVLRGKTVMLDGRVFAEPGEGRNVCDMPSASRRAVPAVVKPTPTVTTLPVTPIPSSKAPPTPLQRPAIAPTTPPLMPRVPSGLQPAPTAPAAAVAEAHPAALPTSRAAVIGERRGSFKISQEIFAHAGNLPPRFTAKHVTSVKQFTRDDLRYLFSVAHDMRCVLRSSLCFISRAHLHSSQI